MSSYKDSVGNVYAHLPKAPPVHTAKSASDKTQKARYRKNNSGQGVTLPTSPYFKYRVRVGKPNGPGEFGNKAGKNKN